MFDGNSSEVPNPFAIASHSDRPRRRIALLSSLKFLVMIALGLALVLAIGNQSRRWLVNRLTHDFLSLSSIEKQNRLTQLSALGLPAIEPLVGALCDEDVEVARTAYDILRTQQNDWAALEDKDSVAHHCELIDAMDLIAEQIDDDRTTWTSSLLQQSISASVSQDSEATKQLYAAATAMLDRMSLSERSGPSILVDSDADENRPRRLTVRSQPLPVSPRDAAEEWTDWPPPPQQSVQPAIVSASSDQQPRVYRSSANNLRPVETRETITLTDVTYPDQQSTNPNPSADDSTLESHSSEDFRPREAMDVLPTSHLIDSPLETYDTKSVIFWLGHSHERLRASAKSELVRRGLSEHEIVIATRIAAGDLQTKLDLVDDIARNGSIDPRPWLLLLMSDPSRDVKLKTVSVLATIKDPAVEQHLRTHILDEPDPTVAFRIRRLLDLR